MATRTTDASQKQIILAVFSDSFAQRKVLSDEIYDYLIERHIWFMPRLSPKCGRGTVIAFYQAGSGVRGYAVIADASPCSVKDEHILKQFGLRHLKVRLDLEDTVTFGEPVLLRPIVDRLQFVTNKKFWGHSVRMSPRRISDEDFNVILCQARVAKSKSSRAHRQ